MNYKRKRKGLTLMEITMVVIVLVVLVSLAAPKFFSMVEKSKQSEAIDVLTRMYKGYKTMVIDGLLNPTTYASTNAKLTNGDAWDPGVTSSDQDWQVLGFEQNPNVNAHFLFAYNFWPKGTTSDPNGCNSMPVSTPTNADIAIALHRNTKGAYSNNFDCSKYIYIYCNNGTIGGSSSYAVGSPTTTTTTTPTTGRTSSTTTGTFP